MTHTVCIFVCKRSQMCVGLAGRGVEASICRNVLKRRQ